MIRETLIWLRYSLAWCITLVASVLALLLCVLLGPRLTWLLACKNWARLILWMTGVRVRVEGQEYLRGPAVFVCNHQSLLDVLVLPAVLPRRIRFVAKKELGRIPLWGWALAATGAVLIDRRHPAAAINEIRRALRRLPQGWSMVLFPEGSRAVDGRLKPFKKGAIHIAEQLGAPLVPVGLVGVRELVPMGAWLVRPGRVYVTVGQPVLPAAEGASDAAAKAAELREAVAACVAAAERRRRSELEL